MTLQELRNLKDGQLIVCVETETKLPIPNPEHAYFPDNIVVGQLYQFVKDEWLNKAGFVRILVDGEKFIFPYSWFDIDKPMST